ncbi:hypothetical protein LTR27_004343 [Elasticomyces elasticus]|nr:hypothetical protein LTR27_004343 [Elasticomyces elasticus]
MTTPGSDRTSEDVRKHGNELYKAGKFTEALTQYKHAAELAPSEAAPLSNLSAVYFELGRYDESYAAGTSALQLLADDNESARQKLYLRRAKSSIHVLNSARPRRINDQIALEACIRVSESSRARVPDAKAAHKKIILELPRYKPQIQDALEYYVIGHDSPESLYEDDLLRTDRRKVSLLFGGIGDARNFHLTLMIIATDGMSGKLGDKLFGIIHAHSHLPLYANEKTHFTLVDVKPAVIARDLIVLLLLDKLGRRVDSSRQGQPMVSACLFYVYLAPVMPARVGATLQTYIQALLDMLEGRRQLPTYLDLPQLYRPEVIKILREWQHDASTEFPARRMRREMVKQRRMERLKWEMQTQPHMQGITLETREEWKIEQKFYEQTGVLPMPHPMNEMYEEDIRKAYQAFVANPSEQTRAVSDIVDANWVTNPTMVDLEWLRNRPRGDGVDIDLAEDPYGFGAAVLDLGIPLETGAGLMENVNAWFLMIAACMFQLKNRIKIEACLGDVTAVLEQIRHGVVGHRGGLDAKSNREQGSGVIEVTLKPVRSGETVVIPDLPLHTTCRTIKEQYAHKSGADLGTIRLVYKTKAVVDDKTLATLGLENGAITLSVVTLVISRQDPPESSSATWDKKSLASQPWMSVVGLKDDTYPQVYDRIHLSNIPDYVGGTLSSFLYATPMTYPGDASYITSTCLRNPPRFPSAAVYNNEYTGLHTPGDLAKTFRVHMSPPKNADYHNFLMSRPQPMPMNDCQYWHHLPGSPETVDLMPRDKLETWLYRVFLKLATPVQKRAIEDFTLIYSPLNLTAFLRVISHLHDVGYPAHWLADVVGSLLSGKVKTSARPPRSEPLTIRETRAERPMMEQSVAPFTAEFQTLVSMWQFALPFGLTSSAVPDVGIIREYRIDFKDVQEYAGNTPVFVLAFCETRLIPPEPWLRP